VPTGGPGGRGGGAATGTVEPDLTDWEFWWNFNKERFLGLRSALYQSVETGGFFGDDAGQHSRFAPTPAEIRAKVVPALLGALQSERQNDIVTGALVALAKIGDARGEDGRSEFEERFKALLPDPAQEIGETAALALGILASEGALNTLADLAGDREPGRKLLGQGRVPLRTRAFAAYGLGLVGARTASNDVRRRIVDELAALIQAPADATPDVQVAALIAFGLTPVDWSSAAVIGERSTISSSRGAQLRFLLATLGEERRELLVRAHVPGALAHLLTREREVPAEAVALREAVLRDLCERIGEHTREREELRRSCILALGQLADLDQDADDARARAELRRASEHGMPQEKAFALIALGQIAGRPGSGEGAAQSLGQLRGLLVGKLDGGATGTRPWAALALGISERELEELGSSAFAPSEDVKLALRSALRGAPQAVAGAFAIALGIARDAEATELLRARLREVREDNQRGYVALALGMVGAAGTMGEIQDIVRDSKYRPELLRQAAIALGLLGDKRLVPELLTMLAESKSLASQAAVASALGFIGDARSIDPLVAMLRDRQITASARGFAAVALGIVADKEPLPWSARISIDLNYRASTSTLTTPQSTGLLDIL
jgi:HEAT repeat protein